MTASTPTAPASEVTATDLVDLPPNSPTSEEPAGSDSAPAADPKPRRKRSAGATRARAGRVRSAEQAAPSDDADDGAAETSKVDGPAGPQPADSGAGEDGAGEEIGELAWVDPKSLVVGANYRFDPRLNKSFIADIAERGVREPIPVRRGPDGALVVRKGKRRTGGAVEAGLTRVRVFIEPGPVPSDDDREGQIERIIDQLGENTHREPHTDAEEIGAHQQLLNLGLTAGQIAKKTKSDPKRVAGTTAVARSPIARGVMERHTDLTFEHLATIAELGGTEGEAAEDAKALVVAAKTRPGQFDHLAQQIRDRRTCREAHAARVTELTAAGVRVVNPDPESTDAVSQFGTQLTLLRPAPTDPSGTRLTEDAHAGCPGHAAHIEVYVHGKDPTVTTTFLCTDPTANGHADRFDGYGGSSGARQAGPMSDEQKAKLARTRKNNKLWDSATTVRMKWLKEFLARKSAPKDAAAFVARTLAQGSYDLRTAMAAHHETACELLGLKAKSGLTAVPSSLIEDAITTATPARLTLINLAMVLGAHEAGTTRDSWRHPSPDSRRYMEALGHWGYERSVVEQLVTDPDADANPDADADPVGDVDPDADAEPVGDIEPDADASTNSQTETQTVPGQE